MPCRRCSSSGRNSSARLGLAMTTRMLVMVSAAIEAATGVALIAVPDLVARLLLGTGLSGSGVAVARVAGFGHLYLGYLRVGAGFIGYLLLPACALHVVLGALLAPGALGSSRSFRQQ